MRAMVAGPCRRPALAAAALVFPVLLGATESAALERLQRRFDLERGLPFSEVYAVQQDTKGFIWIATGGGLFRYDGVDLRPWPREPFRPFVRNLAAGPGGDAREITSRSPRAAEHGHAGFDVGGVRR